MTFGIITGAPKFEDQKATLKVSSDKRTWLWISVGHMTTSDTAFPPTGGLGWSHLWGKKEAGLYRDPFPSPT